MLEILFDKTINYSNISHIKSFIYLINNLSYKQDNEIINNMDRKNETIMALLDWRRKK